MTNLSSGSILALDGRKYMVQDSGSAWSLEMPSASTLRFEVTQRDHFAADPVTKNRSEIAMQGMIKDGTPISVSYGMDIEPGAANTAAFCLLGQFHPAQGTAVSANGPPFSIGLVGEKMTVMVGYTAASGARVTKTIFVDTHNIVRGHDYAMNVHLTFDPYGNGYLAVTRDGLTLVSYAGPLGWKGENGVYWKEGIYRATSWQAMAVDYRSLSLSTGTPTALTSRTGPILQSYTQYDSAVHKTTSISVHTDGSTTTDKYNTSGALIESTTVHADGARDIYDYRVAWQSYVSDHRVYNAGDRLTEFVAIHADGSKAIDNYAISGQSYTADHLNYSARGSLTSSIYHNDDGSRTTDIYGSHGALTQKTIVHADGSRDVHDYGMTGQNYVADHRIYEPTGTLMYFAGIAADGSRLVDNYVVSGKPYSSDQLTFNAKGVLTAAFYHNNDGSTANYKYTSSGSLSKISIVHAGGSRDVHDYGITGQSYVADHRVYNAAGKLTEFVTIASNGSEKATAYAAGVKLSGGPGNDIFYSHGGDSFVFKETFGKDVVNYFHAGNLSNHDVLEFASSAVAGFSHLHMAQAGSDVVITVDWHDTVTLAGVKLSALTWHDFIFS
jgi:hypothetical protein